MMKRRRKNSEKEKNKTKETLKTRILKFLLFLSIPLHPSIFLFFDLNRIESIRNNSNRIESKDWKRVSWNRFTDREFGFQRSHRSAARWKPRRLRPRSLPCSVPVCPSPSARGRYTAWRWSRRGRRPTACSTAGSWPRVTRRQASWARLWVKQVLRGRTARSTTSPFTGRRARNHRGRPSSSTRHPPRDTSWRSRWPTGTFRNLSWPSWVSNNIIYVFRAFKFKFPSPRNNCCVDFVDRRDHCANFGAFCEFLKDWKNFSSHWGWKFW